MPQIDKAESVTLEQLDKENMRWDEYEPQVATSKNALVINAQADDIGRERSRSTGLCRGVPRAPAGPRVRAGVRGPNSRTCSSSLLAALEKRVAEANGTRSNLPAPADAPRIYGSVPRQTRHY